MKNKSLFSILSTLFAFIMLPVLSIGQLSITPAYTAVACNGLSNGSASANPSGGATPYTYSWSDVNSQTTDTATGLSAGTYTVTVTDNASATASASVTITEPNALHDSIVAASTVNVSGCYGGNNGSATVGVAAGTPPYTYVWSSNGGNGPTSSPLAAGIYTVSVWDNCGATASATVTITQPTALIVSASVNQNTTGCANIGSITASLTVLTANFSYTGAVQNWTVPAGVTQITLTTAGAQGGNYYGTGGQGASFTGVCTVTPGDVISIAVGGEGYVYDYGGNGGGGGTFVYDSTITGAEGQGGTPSTAGLLAVAGGGGGEDSYEVYDYSGDGSGAPGGIDLVNNTPTNNDANDNGTGGSGGNGGSAGTDPEYGGGGGTGWINNGGKNGDEYTYGGSDWANGFGGGYGDYEYGGYGGGGGSYYSGGGGGGYNGGGGGNTYTVPGGGGGGSYLNGTVVGSAVATQTGNGSVSIQYNVAPGGTSPYTYSWSDGAAQTTPTATGLAAGSYTVTITDANSCSATASAAIIQVPFTINASVTQNTNQCGSTGSAVVTITSLSTPPYTYSWVPSGGNGSTAGSLAAGTYTVTVTDANNCSATASVTIGQVPFAVSASATQNAVECTSSGSATVTTTSSGTFNFSYTGAVQNWTVPAGVTSITLAVAGARGGQIYGAGGKGASFSGVCAVTPGDVISIAVGGQGKGAEDGGDYGGSGGGGGTFVYDSIITGGEGQGGTPSTAGLLAIAGGGGGEDSYALYDGYTDGSGAPGGIDLLNNTPTNNNEDDNGAGGTGGNGGAAGTYPSDAAGGGTGWISNGVSSSYAVGGNDWASGFSGGAGYASSDYYANGGYGGGGGSYYAGGGGGGYNGGGGGSYYEYPGGGGGGSYLNGSVLGSAVANSTGNGYASIHYNVNAGGALPYTYSWSGGVNQNAATVTGLAPGSYTVTVHDADNCSATASVAIGSNGAMMPTATVNQNATECGSNGSASVSLNSVGRANFSYTGGIQNWTVPAGVTQITLSTAGGQGGSYYGTGGAGASFTGVCTVTPGDVISIVVGGQGQANPYGGDYGGEGGGGGTFVYDSTITGAEGQGGTPSTAGLLAIAGGGGGEDSYEVYEYAGDGSGAPGGIDLLNNTPTNDDEDENGAGGAGGNGGSAGTISGEYSDAGGAGWISNGANGYYDDGGNDWANGFSGGAGYNTLYSSDYGANGGYGGGGGSYYSGGGGGGYNGGGGGSYYTEPGGGGGGSYLNGSVLVSPVANQTGNGSVSIQYQGAPNGTSPYTYSWSGTTQTTPTVTGLAPGSYTVTIQDAIGCSATASVAIEAAGAVNPIVSVNQNTSECTNTGSASVSLNNGGTRNFSYTGGIQNWTVPAGVTQITVTTAGAQGGSYYGTGGMGALFTGVCTVTPGDVISIVVGGEAPPNYYGGSGGGGGTFVYDSTITGGEGQGGTPSNAGLLAIAGGGGGEDSYEVYDYSGDGSGAPGGIDLVNNTPTNNDANDNGTGGSGGNGGSAGTDPEYGGGGGTGWISNGGNDLDGYTHGGNDWANGFSGGNGDYVPGGYGGGGGSYYSGGGGGGYNGGGGGNTYTVPGGGGGGSYLNGTVVVSPTATQTGNGFVIIQVPSSGTPPFTYSWSAGVNQDSATVTGLAVGSYTVTVQDALGCSGTGSVTITAPAALTPSASVSQNITCNNNTTGSAIATLANNVPATQNFSYSGAVQNWTVPAGVTQITLTTAGGQGGSFYGTGGKGASFTGVCTVTPGDVISIAVGSQGQTNEYGGDYGGEGGGGGTFVYDSTITGGEGQGGTPSTAGLLAIAGGGGGEDSYEIYYPGGGNGDGSGAPGGTNLTTNAATNDDADDNGAGGTGGNGGSVGIGADSSSGGAGWISNGANGDANYGGNDWANGFSGGAGYGSSDEGASGGYGGGGGSSYSGGGGGGYNGGGGGNTYTVPGGGGGGSYLNGTVVVGSPVANRTGNGYASIQYMGPGGTPPYTYSWSNGGTNSTASGLSAGTYTLTVMDNNGCSVTASVTLTQPNALRDSIVTASVVNTCNGANTGSATVGVSGGTSPYTYSWSGGGGPVLLPGISTVVPVGGPTDNNLAAGTYTVTVMDSCGASVNATVVITQPNALSDSITTVVNVGCNGANTGNATVGVSGGTSPYTYTWSGGGPVLLPGISSAVPVGGPTDNNLAAGTYTVTVEDACGASVTASAVITQPNALTDSIVMASTINAGCNGASSGSAIVGVSGGTSPYTYSWSPDVSVTDTARGLSAGTYSVTVTDANGCSGTTAIVTITQPNALRDSIVTAATVNETSNGGATGSATVGVQYGTAPYTYSWNDPSSQATATATGLSAGTYMVTVMDNCDASVTASVTITQPTIPLRDSIVTASTINETCNGGSNGSATVGVQYGTIPYTYSWNDPSSQATATATGLNAGSYTVTVTDNTGATGTASVTITQPNALRDSIITAATVNDRCNGGATGSARVGVQFGTSPYTYSWSGGRTLTGNIPNAGLRNTASIGDLSAGTYTVTVMDSCGASLSATVTITQPNVLRDSIVAGSVVSAGCGSAGSATVGVQYGTAPYTYSWSGGGNGSTATNLVAGTYTVSVMDNCGASVSASVVITQPNPLSVTVTNLVNTCYNIYNGSAAITALGGTSPYTYSWSRGAGTNSTTSGLSSANYTVTVLDNCGASATVIATIRQNSALSTATAFTAGSIACNGGSTGVAKVSVSGGSSPYIYSWSPNVSSTFMANGISAGIYTVTVIDNCGASVTSSLVVSQPALLRDSAILSYPACGGGTSGATIGVKGGTSPYSYAWSPNVSTTASATGLSVRSYAVQVKDANGCSSNVNFSILQSLALRDSIVKSATVNVSCNGSSTGSATVGVKYGIPPYTYSWSGNGGNSSTAGRLTAGVYTVTVNDAGSCTVTASVTITQPAALSPNAYVGVNVACNGGITGQAKVSVSGGSTPYTYSWSPGGATISTVGGLSAGTYTVTLRDNCAASATSSIVLTQPALLRDSVANLYAPACTSGATGEATLGVKGGIPPYKYAWSPNVSSTDSASGLTVRSYAVQVKDANGCSSNLTVGVVCSNGKAPNDTYQPENNCCPVTDNINLYPNPNTGQFTISGLQTGMILEMYDYTGKMISTMTTTNESMQLNIFSQANGVYLIRILDKNGNLIGEKKVVKTQ